MFINCLWKHVIRPKTMISANASKCFQEIPGKCFNNFITTLKIFYVNLLRRQIYLFSTNTLCMFHVENLSSRVCLSCIIIFFRRIKMCLIIDYKFLNWHLMRFGRVINIPPCAECSQAVELFSFLTLKIIPASQSVWSKVNSSCPSLLLALQKGICSFPVMCYSLSSKKKLESPQPIDSSSEMQRDTRLSHLPLSHT